MSTGTTVDDKRFGQLYDLDNTRAIRFTQHFGQAISQKAKPQLELLWLLHVIAFPDAFVADVTFKKWPEDTVNCLRRRRLESLIAGTTQPKQVADSQSPTLPFLERNHARIAAASLTVWIVAALAIFCRAAYDSLLSR